MLQRQSKNRPPERGPVVGLAIEETQLAQRTMVRLAHYDMVEHFNVEQLPRANQIACDFNVCFAVRQLSTRKAVPFFVSKGGT